MKLFLNILSYLSSLPSQRALYRLSYFLAILFFDVLRIRRKVALHNVKIAFEDGKSPKERVRIARESYAGVIHHGLQFLSGDKRYPSIDIDVSGYAHMQEAVNRKKGVIVVTLHLANFEMLAYHVVKHFNGGAVIVKKMGDGGLNDWISDLRKRRGYEVIFKGKPGEATAKVIEVLKQGKNIGYFSDQHRPNAPYVPFFGVPARTNPSFLKLWKKSGCSLLMAYTYRKKDGNQKLVYLPLWEPVMCDSEEEFYARNLKTLNETWEKVIAEHPEQYYWIHKRWK